MKSDNLKKVLNQLGENKTNDAYKPERRSHRASNTEDAKLILVIDDEPSSLELASVYLEKAGYRVLAALSVRQAKKILSANPNIALIMTDLKMPEEDGFMMLEFLKNSGRYCHIPAIVSTSSSSSAHVARAIELGARDYVAKPFDSENLLQRIRKIVERRKRTILLVTDEPTCFPVLSRSLTPEGFALDTAANGKEACDKIAKECVDIVISELAFEDMTGFDLMLKIQDIRPGIPFIFLGDSNMKIKADAVISAGGFGYIERPMNNFKVIRMVTSACSKFSI